MPGTTVRISPASRETLRKLAAQAGEPMQMTLDRAIESYRRQRFLEEVNAAYAVLRQDPKAWSAVTRERAEWDATLEDGLESGETRPEGRRAIRKAKKGRKT
jgi:hypothetical protein